MNAIHADRHLDGRQAPPPHGRVTTALTVAMAMLWVLTAGGCGSGPPERAAYHPVFPAPPAEPRLIHRADVRGVEDLVAPSWLDNLVAGIAGRRRQSLGRPSAVAHDDGRHLYIADTDRQAVHVFDLRNGKTRLIERAEDQHLVSPVGLAALPDGRLLVADSVLGKVFAFDRRGRVVASMDEPARPTGLHYDPARRELYVVDTLSHQVLVYDEQLRLRRRVGEPGNGPGQLNFPTHVFVDGRGQLYVTDAMNFRVQVFDPQGRYRTHIGEQGNATGHLGVPKGVAVDSFGHIYIADAYFSTVQVFDQRGRFLLAFGSAGKNSGQFHLPNDLAMDEDNRLYIADSFNQRVQIFQYVGGASDDPE